MISINSSFLRFLNILTYALMIIVNGLAGGTTIIGGKTTAQISDANPTLITPAGYTFSIWGVIYILLGVFVLYQALPTQQSREYVDRIGYLFSISNSLNVLWIFLWQFEHLALSVIVIFLLLATLIMIYLRLEIGKSRAPLRERIAFHVPFSVYLGWITIASIANVAIALVSAGWSGFGIGPEIWAVTALVAALLIALMVVMARRDLAYGLVVIWALIGIAVNHGANQAIVALTMISVTILAIISTIVTLLKVRHTNKVASF